MRFLAAIAGILISVPPLIFFWIGAQTFVRQIERVLAFAVAAETGALLLLSIALVFTTSVQRIQVAVLLSTVVTIAAILIGHRLLR